MEAFIGSRSFIKILEILGLAFSPSEITTKMKACLMEFSQVIRFTKNTLNLTAKETSQPKIQVG